MNKTVYVYRGSISTEEQIRINPLTARKPAAGEASRLGPFYYACSIAPLAIEDHLVDARHTGDGIDHNADAIAWSMDHGRKREASLPFVVRFRITEPTFEVLKGRISAPQLNNASVRSHRHLSRMPITEVRIDARGLVDEDLRELGLQVGLRQEKGYHFSDIDKLRDQVGYSGRERL